MLCRLSHGADGPTPIGVFRDVDGPCTTELMSEQLEAATTRHGRGDLAKLLQRRGHVAAEPGRPRIWGWPRRPGPRPPGRRQFRVGTGEPLGRALLCLVGVVVDGPEGSGAPRELTDLLDERLTRGPLAEVLADPGVEVVLHAGRQDVAPVRVADRGPGVLDTQAAAGFAGFGAQTGYGSLLNDVLGLRLAKSASFTRWDDRPLVAPSSLRMPATTSPTCCAWPTPSRSGWRSPGGSSGRGVSAGAWRSRATSATRGWPGQRLP